MYTQTAGTLSSYGSRLMMQPRLHSGTLTDSRASFVFVSLPKSPQLSLAGASKNPTGVFSKIWPRQPDTLSYPLHYKDSLLSSLLGSRSQYHNDLYTCTDLRGRGMKFYEAVISRYKEFKMTHQEVRALHTSRNVVRCELRSTVRKYRRKLLAPLEPYLQLYYPSRCVSTLITLFTVGMLSMDDDDFEHGQSRRGLRKQCVQPHFDLRARLLVGSRSTPYV